MSGPWYEGRVTRAWAESQTLRGLAFAADEVARRYRAPGQYVRLGLNGDQKPYALASEPGAAELELLFKIENQRTDAMAALAPGDPLRVGAPEGRGFPVADHAGRDLILCAAGSGIAPLRAVIRCLLPRRASYGAVTLFYGQRDTAHFAYAEEWPTWRAAGVEVIAMASGEAGGGRVPDAVRARRPRTEGAVAYVAGMKAMILEVSRALGELGLPEERIFLNY